MPQLSRCLLAACCLGGIAAGQGHQRLPGLGGGSEELSVLYPARAKTFIKASYDPEDLPSSRNNGNDDGFSGQNLCESYRAIRQGTPMAVLADIEGRGGFMGLFFRNFWSDWVGMPLLPQEQNRAQILLDGRVAYDRPLPDFFRNPQDPGGQLPPFDGPFTGHRSGAWLTHGPITWRDRFVVQVFDDPFHNAARFHKVAGSLDTPEHELRVPDRREWERIATLAGAWPHRAPRIPVHGRYRLAQDQAAVLRLPGPATLLELTCRVGNPEDWADLWVRCTWDGAAAPAVDLPLRALGARLSPPFQFPLHGLLLGNDGDDTITCYFPMPFAQSGVIELINRNDREVALEVVHASVPRVPSADWGHFHATWNEGTTRTGEAFRGPRLRGRGVLRYLALETGMDDTGRIPSMHLTHLEGDLCVRINGNRGDEHNFAASETSIGKWGWYLSPSDQAFVSQGSFQSSLLIRNHPAGFRHSRRIMGSTLVFDPVHFVDGIEIVLEHGVQNRSNADYALAAFFYLQDEPGRRTVMELDVGDPVAEAAAGAVFTQWSRYQRTGGFLRDQFFGTRSVTDSVRHIRDFYRFRFAPEDEGHYPGGYGLGFRLDRLASNTAGLCQAEVWVDGQYAGLLHCATHSPIFPWKEGGEVEVEIPRRLTAGKSSFLVEVRPRPGSDPLQIARIWVYGYR